MRVVFIGGSTNADMRKHFGDIKDITITNTFNQVRDLTDEVSSTGLSFLEAVDSIAILDYGFEGNVNNRISDFIALQDILNVRQATIKLYLLTKNSDMYDKLQNNTDGIPGILYTYTQVMLVKGKYSYKIIEDILKGSRDLQGLYHPDVTKENAQSRLEADKELFIQDAKSVDDEILTYGINTPISKLSESDYIDSDYTKKKIMREKKEERQEQARIRKEQQMLEAHNKKKQLEKEKAKKKKKKGDGLLARIGRIFKKN